MIDNLSHASSIPLDVVQPRLGALDRSLPSSRRIRYANHSYSWGEDVISSAPPLHESYAAGSQFNEIFFATVRRMTQLLALPPGWDSYGAKAIDRHRALAALYLVWLAVVNGASAPVIVPTSDGGIQLEWHRRGADLEIKVVSEALLQVFFEDLATGESFEDEIGVDWTPLRVFLGRVAGE